MRRPRSWLARYGIAVTVVALALAVKAIFSTLILGESSFLLLSVAVLVAAVLGGLGPGVLATFLAVFLGDYFFLSPVGTLVPSSVDHGLRTLLFLVQGLAISAIGAVLVSQRTLAEENRKESLEKENRLADAQRIARIGNWDYDVERNEAYWSDELYRIFGCEPREFAPNRKTFFRLIHPDDRSIVRGAIRDAAGGAGRSSVEYRIVRQDGEIRTVSTEYEPILDVSGRMVRLVGTIQDVTERERAEETLRESEGRFRSTFEQAAVGMAHVGFGGGWLRVNEKLCEIVGYTRDELLGMTFQDITHPEDLQGDVEEFHRLIAGEIGSYSREKRYLRKDGSAFWINLTVGIGEDAAGRQEYTIAVIEDITERKRYEQELVWLASYPQQSPNPIIEADLNGVPTYLNPAARRHFPELTDPENRHPLLEDVEVVAREASQYNGGNGEIPAREIQVGERFYYRVTSRVPRSESVRIYATDITERRRAEEARRREEERFEALIRYGSDINVILNAEGTVIYESPAVERVIGYRPDERVGRSAFEFVHPEEREGLAETLSNFAGEENPDPMTVEYRAQARDGSWHNFEAIAVNLLRNPSVGGIVISSRDITERKRAEGIIRQSEERYRAVIEQMLEGIFMFDPHTKRFLESNTAFERMFGYTAEELQGMRVYDVISHEPEDIDASVRRVMDERRIFVGERKYRRKDGAVLDVGVSGSVISYGDDREVICAIAEDITERKRTENQERFLAQLTQEMLSLTEPDEIAATTTRMLGEHLGADRCAYADVEKDEDHFLVLADYGGGLPGLTGRLRVSDFGPEALRMMRANEPYVVFDAETDERVGAAELSAHREIGARSLVCVPLCSKGKFVAVMGVHQKTPRCWSGEEVQLIRTVVSRCWEPLERARAIQSLRQSETLYRAVVEQATENIFLVDVATGRILENNAAFHDSLGYTEDDLSRITLYDLVDAERESLERNIQRILELGSLFIGERRYLCKDGSARIVEVGVSVIHRAGRETLCVVAHDITERKQAEEAVIEVRQAERSRIARDLHDDALQEIIYALQEAQIIEEISGSEQSLVEVSDSLRRSIEGIRSAIFELRLEETLKESFLASVRNTVDLHRRMARRSHRIELEVSDDFPREPHREVGRGIIRITQEALSNARRHSDARQVTVSLRVEGEEALVEVADDGRGFDPESSEGGVGTHSTRQRAWEMGGDISVHTAPGGGARVCLRVPLENVVEKGANEPLKG